MSRKKGNVGYLLTLICIVLIIAALLGSFSNLGGVVDKIKNELSDTDTKDDSSTDKGTASEGTGSSNTNSGDSDVRNVFYYGSSQFKVMTESTSATEGVILFGFESGYDADTKWYCTWSIDEAFLDNTSCSFIPYDYGSGATLYDIDECYNYNFQSSNNTYEPVVSGPVGDTHFTHLTHQFSGVGKGNTYVLRMFKYTLTDGETVADVLNEISPYIEFITFCTYANVQFKNPNYGNFSGTLLPPETDTPETESLYSFTLLGYIPTDGLTVRYQTIENGEIVERTATVNTTTDIHVVGNTNIYITFPVEGILFERVSGVEEITYTSTEAVYRVSDKIAYVYFKYVSSEPSEPEIPSEPDAPPEVPDPEIPSEVPETESLYSFSLLGYIPTDGLTVRYQTIENGEIVERTATVNTTIDIHVVGNTNIYITFPVEGIVSERVSGAEEISYTSTEAVYCVRDSIAYVMFKHVSSES